MNKIEKRNHYLPATLDELSRFVLIGREKLNSVRAEIRVINKLDLAKDVREQKRDEAQMLAGALLDAESKIGSLISEIPKASGGNHKAKSNTDSILKTNKIKELGFSQKQSEQFQQLAENPEIIEQVKSEAIENEDLPTRTEVLRRIKEKVKIDNRDRLAEESKNLKINIDLRLGDFENVFTDIKNNSVDCIITDPPYPYKFIECWSKLSRFAKRVLKENGFCLTYSGQTYLPEVINRMSENLDYYWTFAMYHEGATQIVNGTNIMCRWKPILIFQNGKKKIESVIMDYFISEKREKSEHEWQQSESGVKYLIEKFTKPGDLILDPFAGSGTTLKVARDLKRNIKGAEIDEKTFNIAKGNLYE